MNRAMGVGGAARDGSTPSSAYTKGRTLPADADRMMQRWLVTDPVEALAGYFDGSTRHAEFVARFGPNGQKFQDVLEAARKAGASATEISTMSRAFAAATGTGRGAGSATTGLTSWVQMWGMRQLLTRALFSSAAEPLTVGMRSGRLRDSADAMVSTWKRFLTPDSWQGDSARMERERAEMLGVVGDATHEMMMASRVEAQNLSKRHGAAVNQMLTLTGQNRLFAASRIAASRIAEHTVARLLDETGGKNSASARSFLAEMGMDDATAGTVRDWLKRHGGRPPVTELHGDTPAANAYRTAVGRFVNESVMNPMAIDKPTGASERHPLAQLAYSIMSFQYAFTRNVLIRTGKSVARTAHGVAAGDLSAGDAMRMAVVPLAGMAMLAAAQFATGAARDQMFSRQVKAERPPLVNAVVAMDRAGLFGNVSPLVNLLTSARYERDASGALAGAYLGNMLRQAGDMTLGLIPQSLGGPNSPSTNNAEWAATRAAWGLVAAPAMVGAIAAAPLPAWAKVPGALAAMYAGSSDAGRGVADAVAGPRTQRGRAPGSSGSRSGGNPFMPGRAAGGHAPSNPFTPSR